MRSTRTFKAMAALAVLGVAMLLTAAAASAQGYPGGPTLTITSPSVPQGGALGATMTGCAPGEAIHFVLNSTPYDMGTVPADPTGKGSVTITVPSNFPPGPHTVVSTCGNLTLSADVTVTSATITTTTISGSLPTTGSNTDGLVRGGIALVALGALLVVAAAAFARRRNGTTTA